MQVRKRKVFRQGLVAAAVSMLFQPGFAPANPVGPQVVNGSVSMSKPNAATLNITNSPGAVINWQGFSIGVNEVTRFIQQSASSAVLNRVVGPDISAIQGQLQSNGRVFLINPAGIVIGPNAMIDTAGFIGSSLNMSNADFLAGKLRFSGDATAGSVINQGWIRTPFGGNVLLVAPHVENSGLIETPGGELILAAGQKLTVSSLEQDGVQFEVQAPTDTVLNVGRLLADGGAVGVFAGSLRHSGEIRASALARDEGGNIILKAAGDIQLTAGSVTSTDGKAGGNITIASNSGLSRVAGTVSATGSAGEGGNVAVLGHSVTAADGAVIDVSGSAGGGNILLGGDFQGANAAVPNAANTFVGLATLRADATQKGNGGNIVVWGDDSTRYYGSLSAQGGPQGGNGGFAEVSGRNHLLFQGGANLGAARGATGGLLLDPLDLYVVSGGGVDAAGGGTRTSTLVDEAGDFPSNAATVDPATLAGLTANVTLYASRYLRIGSPITLTNAGQALTATVGTYTAPAAPDPNALDAGNTPNQLDIAANITTSGGAVTLNAPLINSVGTVKIATAGGAIALNSGGNLATSSLSLDAGTGAVMLSTGTTAFQSIQIADVSGGSVTASAPGFISTGKLSTGSGALNVTSTASSISTSDIASTGGAVNLSALKGSVSTSDIKGGGGAVTLASRSGVSTGTIDTTGAVALSASAGSIFATVDNASKVTASAVTSNSFSTATVNIDSSTALNADTITATASGCSGSFSCAGAQINLSAAGDITVGTVTATAPATSFGASVFSNSIFRSVSITSNGGSILAAGAGSLITATDVSLATKQGSGGGVGSAATALQVNTERLLSVAANGDFNVHAVGSGPTQLDVTLGAAATGKTYSGTLVRDGGGMSLTASATDTAVTVSNLDATGSAFSQRRYGSDPYVSLSVPNGALTLNTATISEGDTKLSDFSIFPSYSTAALPVYISADGALTVNSYTRQNTASSFPNTTSFSSNNGAEVLGTVSGGQDYINISTSGSGAKGAVTVSSLTTANDVSISGGGDVTVGSIDTSGGAASGIGNVNISTSTSTAAIKAQADGSGLEINAGASVNLSAKTIGSSGFAHPFDVKGTSVSLTSNGAVGGAIGYAGAPVFADTQDLTITAAQLGGTPANGATFNVTTGATALTNLSVTADPQAVGSGGLATVTTEGGAGTYNFVSDGKNFTFNVGKVPTPNQFVDGQLSFTANSGDVTLGNADMGASGSLAVTAYNGSIVGNPTLDGGGTISLTAGQSTSSGTAVSVNVGNVGAGTQLHDLFITAGNFNRSGTVTAGTIEVADNLNISTTQGGITTLDIGDGARAGAVNLTANERFSTTGAINVGKVTAIVLSVQDRLAGITTGNLDLTSGINIGSENTVTLGSVITPTLNIGPVFFFTPPTVTIAAINGVQNLNITSNTTTITGSVTGDPTVGDTLSINGSNGVTLTGGSVTGGDGSSITINSGGAKAFEFQTLNAGAKGAVNVTSASGIQQDAGGSGITGGTVALSATGSGAAVAQAGGTNLQLNSVQALTLNTAGPVALDGGGSILNSLAITHSQAVTGASPFTLTNLGGGQAVTLAQSGGDLGLTVASSAQPLAFSLRYTAAKSGVVLAGGGITSGGGDVSVTATSGGFDGSTGGITSGGAMGGGAVSLTAAGAVSTGAISTAPTGTGSGGSIGITATGATGTVAVNGNLTTGSGGGAININAQAAVTDVGASTLNADGGVTVSVAADGADIGSLAAPLLITAPAVTLVANGNTLGGTAYATLSGTNALSLSADNGFSVSSNTAFDTLGVTTRGSGAGLLALTAPGQSYTFARPATDLFGTALTNTLQVLTATGATTASFTARDGDLLVGGAGTSITVPNLTLATGSSTGDVKLQGTAVNPLTLTNTTQTVSAGRDVLVRGVADLEGGTQSISAGRSVVVQAEQGSVTIGGANQTIQSTGFLGGGTTISFKGGAAANQTVTVTASNSQLITSPNSGSSASIQVLGGDGAGSSARILYTGSGTQTLHSGGQVLVAGSDVGTGSIAEIRTATGSQYITSASSVNVAGGKADGAAARIVNTGSGNQQVGESSFFAPYRPASIAVTAGAGNDAVAEITAAGAQSLQGAGSGIVVQGGGGNNAFARIDSTSSAQQTIGCPSFSFCQQTGSLTVAAGTGTGAYARVTNSGAQSITVSTQVGLTGNAASATSASITGLSQSIQGSVALTAGSGDGANALLQSGGFQNISGGATLKGGGAVGAIATAQVLAAGDQSIGGSAQLSGSAADGGVARISSGGSQFISNGAALTAGSGQNARVEILQSSDSGSQFIGGNVILTAGGSTATPVAGATALIEGHNQSINGNTISLSGGAGTGASTSSDAVIRNLSGSQTVSGNLVTLTGGTQFSSTGIVNLGDDTQSITGNSGITLTAPAAALASAPVTIQNTSTAEQTLTTFSGGLVLNNQGAGAVTISTGGVQNVSTGYIDVVTAAGATGDARLTAAGDQWLLTRNGTAARATGQGSMTVVARGTGTANIESGGSQLIELDYPALMQGATLDGRLTVGDAAGTGVSRIGAVDQTVFAKSIRVQGGSGAGARSELMASGQQVLSVLGGTLDVRGGSGSNALAQIDPTTQTVLANGTLNVIGGSGAGAAAKLDASGAQTVATTGSTGDIAVTGGGSGANAEIIAGGAQQVWSSGALTLTGGNGSSATIQGLAQMIAANSIVLTGGTGAGSATTADALLHSLSGDQRIVSGGVLTLDAGSQFSTAAIVSDGGGTQTVTAQGNADVTAGSGGSGKASITSGGAQSVTAGGGITLTGGGAGSSAAITAAGTQQVASGGALALNAGNAAGASATLEGQAQSISAGGITLSGGDGSDAVLRSLAGDQSVASSGAIGIAAGPQNSTAGLLSIGGGTQTVTAKGAVDVVAGKSANALARVVSGGAQSLVAGGGITLTGDGSAAEITAVGGQQITAGSVLTVGAGNVAGASATVQGQAQNISAGGITLSGGNGSDAVLRSLAGDQTVASGGAIGIAAGPQNSTAGLLSIGGGTQTVTAKGAVAVMAGSGANALARVASGGAQSLAADGGITLSGGGSAADITAAGAQQVSSGGVLALHAGNTAGASATVQGQSQNIKAGGITLAGGNGADAVLRNLAGDQVVAAGAAITLTGGPQLSTTGILNQGTGAQTLTAGGGIGLTGGSAATSSTLIQNTPATVQTLTSTGGFTLNNPGAGLVSVSSGDAQSVTAGFVDVLTAGGSTGNAVVSAKGDQTIHTTNGIASTNGALRVLARGTGMADIESGAKQTLAVDYPEQLSAAQDGRLIIGGTNAAGTSRIAAVDQTVTAKSILIQTGGPAANTRSELISTRLQTIKVLNGNLEVRGGSGNDSLAQIDPVQQDITVNGNVFVVGGSGTNAVAQIVSDGSQTIITTGDINVIGGTGFGADARITAVGQQTLAADGLLNVQSNTSGGGLAFVFGGNAGLLNLLQNPSTTVLTLTDTQDEAIDDSAPQEASADTNPRGRAQICY